jgi:hypothetical protein
VLVNGMLESKERRKNPRDHEIAPGPRIPPEIIALSASFIVHPGLRT